LDTKLQAYGNASTVYNAHKALANSSVVLMSSGVPTNYDGNSLAAASTVLHTAETERNAAQESLELANQLVTDLQQALEDTNTQIASLNTPVAPVPAPVPTPAPTPGPADPFDSLKKAADLLGQGNTQASNDQFDAFVNSGVAFPTPTLRATFEQAYAFGFNVGKKKLAYNAVLAWRAANP
jgi:hypothetical protein